MSQGIVNHSNALAIAHESSLHSSLEALSAAVTMFSTDNRKRPSPERFEQDTRLKKLCTTPDERSANILPSNQYGQHPIIEQHSPSHVPLIPHSISHHSTKVRISDPTYDSGIQAVNIPLLTVTDHGGLHVSNAHSDNDLDLSDDVSLLEEEEVVLRACFGVVSHFNLCSGATTDLISLS